MTGIQIERAISVLITGMLLTTQIALSQPIARSPAMTARPTSQTGLPRLVAPKHAAPTAGTAHDPAFPVFRTQRSATLIEKAVEAWVMAKPLPSLLTHDREQYDGPYPAPQPGPAATELPEWLSRFDFLLEAGKALQDATSFEAPGMSLKLDPLNLRCTFTLKLNGDSTSHRGN